MPISSDSQLWQLLPSVSPGIVTFDAGRIFRWRARAANDHVTPFITAHSMMNVLVCHGSPLDQAEFLFLRPTNDLEALPIRCAASSQVKLTLSDVQRAGILTFQFDSI